MIRERQISYQTRQYIDSCSGVGGGKDDELQKDLLMI